MNIIKEGLNLQGQQVDDCFAKAEGKGLPYAKKPLYETDADLKLPDGRIFPVFIEVHGHLYPPFVGSREEPPEPGGAVVEDIDIRPTISLREYFEGLIDGD